jgi:hypothetical protein
MSKTPSFEELIELAKKKAAEEHGDEIILEGGPSTRHVNRIKEVLEEHKDEDVITDLDDSTHEQYTICRSEEYAVVTGTELNYHYVFTKKFKAYEMTVFK